MTRQAHAVVLLSGGLDSAVTLAAARHEGYACHALSIAYGQRHAAELEAARRVAASLTVVEHKILSVDLRAFGGSALTSDAAVPKDRPMAEMTSAIPITYVPARNTIFLSLALAWAEALGAFDLWIGVNALDYSGYPDCRPGFIRAFEAMSNLATKAGVEESGTYRIHTPLIRFRKSEIVTYGRNLRVDFSLTHSCYDPDPQGSPCGRCDACHLRRKGFAEAGIEDPLPYPDR
ncbi:MAG: 7-cyano-7-deazaguanine synthase QueC [Deltaproteobacteria bacterium RBG_13_65_10]|nr:MAG: 7-cyano-7-deazaguanine synthase QueC [Deltaproteobacteria bacterium RBG_13_65_10]